MEDFYDTSVDNARRFGELSEEAVDRGFSAFKSMAVPPTMALEGNTAINAAASAVASMREAVGPDIDIMVDCHARPSPAMGRRFAEALEPYGLYFLEEPCWVETASDMANIRAAVSTPIATGERLTHLSQFKDLLAVGACDVIQPDITHCGGLSAVRKIAAIAEAHRIAIAPHNPQGPVSTSASIEFGFATPDYVICETGDSDGPWRNDVASHGYQLDKKSRTVQPSQKPGLGVEINEKEIAKHPFEQELLQRVFYRDGSVGDW